MCLVVDYSEKSVKSDYLGVIICNESSDIPQLRAPIAPMPKLPPQQALLPQENPFDINLELIPYQGKEVEAVFKAPELEDFPH